jgi:tol-pal system protein YbgF
MKNGKCTILTVAAFVFLSGCASQSKQQAERETLFPEIDVVKINGKIAEALQGVADENVRTDSLEKAAADLDERMLAISEEMAGTSPARVEELETRLSLLTEAIKEQQAQIAALKQAAAAPMVDSSSIKNTPPAKQVVKPASSLLVSPEYTAYQAGLRLCNARNYKQAIAAFTDVAQRYPGGRYTDEANYWTGECRFRLADYAAAITDFEKTAVMHGSTKADDALFRMGQAYVKLEQKENAAASFKRLLEEFPGSEYVPRAEKYLKQLK